MSGPREGGGEEPAIAISSFHAQLKRKHRKSIVTSRYVTFLVNYLLGT